MRKWYQELRRGDLVLHVYRDEGEQVKYILELLNWIDDGEKMIFLYDRADQGKKDLLSNPVIDAAIEEGRLEVVPAKHHFYTTGRFRAETIIDLINLEYHRALEQGYSGLVMAWDLTWLSMVPEDFQAHAVQQSRLMLSSIPRNLTLFAEYKEKTFDRLQLDMLHRVHQLAVTEGRLDRNFWVVSTSALGGRPSGVRASPVKVEASVNPTKGS